MVCEMGEDYVEDIDMEVLPSMWPEDIGKESGNKFNIEKHGMDQDMLEEVPSIEDSSVVDFKRLLELTNYSEKGSNQLGFLVKQWEYKQANAVRLLNEEIDILSKQRQEVELKQLEILEEHRFEGIKYVGDKRSISILDDVYDEVWEAVPKKKHDIVVQDRRVEIDAEYDTIKYWKQRAMQLDKMLEVSVQREQVLLEKLQENIKSLEKLSSPVEELSQILKRADNFLHFVLQNAPVVIGHQDKELRYRFIYNHFPSLDEEDIIGRTDVEIFTGAGVKESQDFKREVMERGLPAKREITFETELFGAKTFLIYVEPVFSKAGDTIGVNYMGMDITDQVIKREKMANLRELIAVQKAKETELNKTIHITEETMRAKQMLATMSHEIRSPLTGVVSMAEILSNSRLDREQRQLLDVMISSGDLVLQLINDILDLSKVESGVMKLESTKFRPREVVKHVVQTAAASLQKELTLEGHIAEDVPSAVIGDVLRIRQILTNLISNAIKFTHEGKVGINLYVIPEPTDGCEAKGNQTTDRPEVLANKQKEEAQTSQRNGEGLDHNCASDDGNKKENLVAGDAEKQSQADGITVWIRCDVYDTGIGIPDNAIPNLFRKYMQVSADHARKYGGTGLGLAICKQLVELMGGRLTVTSKVNCGSTFTFVLPYKVSPKKEQSDELSDMDDDDIVSDANNDDKGDCFFQFEPRTLGSLFSTGGETRPHKLSTKNPEYSTLNKLKNLAREPYSFPSNNCISRDIASLEDASSVTDTADSFPHPGSSPRQDLERGSRTADHVKEPCQNGMGGQFHTKITDSPRCKKTCIEASNTTKSSNSLGTFQTQEHEKSDRSPRSRTNSSTEPEKAENKPKILLVEDSKVNVMVTTSLMKMIGHKIDVVNNGVEAVRAVQSQRYDLVLMDVCMPVMDGLQATRLIRSFEETGSWDAAVEAGIERPSSDSIPNGLETTPSRRRLPIIAMTANTVGESSEECLASGMDSFVSKPVNSQKLKECLKQYLPS